MKKALEEFLNSPQRNAWLTPAQGIAVYARKSVRPFDRQALKPNLHPSRTLFNCLDLATIDVDDDYKGKGLFTELLIHSIELCQQEKIPFILVENCVEPKLRAFFVRQQWTLNPHDLSEATFYLHSQQMPEHLEKLQKHLNTKQRPLLPALDALDLSTCAPEAPTLAPKHSMGA